MKIRGILAAVLPALLLAAGLACNPGPPAPDRAWWSHIEYLASDALEGRDTGSEGYRKAADYVAKQFAKAGAQPGAGDSFLQPIRFVSRTIREEECSLELIRRGEARSIALGDEAVISMSLEPVREIEAPLVFAGYAMSVAEAGYDDLAGLDVEGKIVVYISGGPSTIESALRAHAQSSEERWNALRAAGARGLVSVSNPKKEDVPWERSIKNRLKPRLTMAERALVKRPGLEFSASLNGANAHHWFEGSGHSLDDLLDLASREEPLPRFQMVGTLRARVSFDEAPLTSDNVVGVIPGSDPQLKDEFVVLSGHLDHLGVGGAVDGDSIYNGAMDNASGIATMIEIARMAKANGAKPRRTLVLLAVTGEEKGLLGSRHFAAHPSVAGGDIVANINMDMFLPIVPFKFLTVYGRNESDLGDWIGPIAEAHGAVAQDDPEPHRRIFVRSDQYNFIRSGVPALSFKVGFAKDSPEAQVFANWTKQRYHAPSDDLDQPVDLDAAVAFTSMLYDFCMDIANRDERPRWKDDSFFKRFAEAAGR